MAGFNGGEHRRSGALVTQTKEKQRDEPGVAAAEGTEVKLARGRKRGPLLLDQD